MALEKALKLDDSAPFKFEKGGDTLDGYYVGTFDVLINERPTKKSIFKTKDGLFSVLGQVDMLKQLQDNNCLNIRTVVTFTGQTKALKGKSPMKLYDVSFDREDTYEGGGVDTTPSEEEPDWADDSGEETQQIAAPPARQQAPAANVGNAQAKARQFLQRGKAS